MPGAPRTFVHKCHGGDDSLVTARESFEVATRFFHGDAYAASTCCSAQVKRGFDWIGKSEMFFGMSVKPRRVDFDLFHQSAEAENCYGPFRTRDLSDEPRPRDGFGWAGPDRLIWEGWFDTARINPAAPSPRRRRPARPRRPARLLRRRARPLRRGLLRQRDLPEAVLTSASSRPGRRNCRSRWMRSSCISIATRTSARRRTPTSWCSRTAAGRSRSKGPGSRRRWASGSTRWKRRTEQESKVS